MKLPRKLILKIYFFIFSTMTLANFIWLLYPDADPYVFYHILIAWTEFYRVHYYLAILKCMVALACLIPLYGFSFDRPTSSPQFWRWLFVLRVVGEVFGNFYEFMFIKSSYHMMLGYGLTTTGVFVLPLIPSYVAHYCYAFQRQPKQ